MQLNLVVTHRKNILQQLQLEEALLRTNQDNWCLINHGSPPSIVMGISGKTQDLIDYSQYINNPIPIIRRFTGGGTVVVDHDTLFVSFIMHRSIQKGLRYPQDILSWTEPIYSRVFQSMPFCIQENDYTFGNKKIGGNAQCITKERWVHHTTFLWDYNQELMAALKLPAKTPPYRKNRPHSEFITCLNLYYPSLESILNSLVHTLSQSFTIVPVAFQDLCSISFPIHRQTVHSIEDFFNTHN